MDFLKQNRIDEQIMEEYYTEEQEGNIFSELSPYIIGMVFLLIVIVAIFFISEIRAEPKPENNFSAPPPISGEFLADSSEEQVYFKKLNLSAEAVYVYDALRDKVLYSKNAEVQMPLASLTKLMLALVASDVISDEEIIKITSEDIDIEGDNGLYVNERWTFSELLDFTVITSSNDAASAIASAAVEDLRGNDEGYARAEGLATTSTDRTERFIQMMNQKAKDLNLGNTFFVNETGLDTSDSVSGGYGSAVNVAHLMEHIIENKPDLIDATTHKKLKLFSNIRQHTAINTNKIIDKLPGVIASKTGYTDLAGGNLAVAFDAGLAHPVIAVVLNSTFDGRFTDMEKIVETVLRSKKLHSNDN